MVAGGTGATRGAAVVGLVGVVVTGVGRVGALVAIDVVVDVVLAGVGVEAAKGIGDPVGAVDPHPARAGTRSRRAVADRPRMVDREVGCGRGRTRGGRVRGMGDCPLGVGSNLETSPYRREPQTGM